MRASRDGHRARRSTGGCGCLGSLAHRGDHGESDPGHRARLRSREHRPAHACQRQGLSDSTTVSAVRARRRLRGGRGSRHAARLTATISVRTLVRTVLTTSSTAPHPPEVVAAVRRTHLLPRRSGVSEISAPSARAGRHRTRGRCPARPHDVDSDSAPVASSCSTIRPSPRRGTAVAHRVLRAGSSRARHRSRPAARGRGVVVARRCAHLAPRQVHSASGTATKTLSKGFGSLAKG